MKTQVYSGARRHLRPLLLTCCLAFFFLMKIGAQDIERCATDPLPDAFEQWLRPLIQEYKDSPQRGNVVVTLPMVFHIVHNGEAVGDGANISLEQVESQIEVLNEDFRKMGDGFNNHPDGADVMIEFCIAGINRLNRGEEGWTTPPYTKCYVNDNIKPATIWDPDSYINVWVLESLTRCDGTGSLLGYSTWPESSGLSGVPSNDGTIEDEDGVVIVASSAGRPPANPFGGVYNRGRTLTHELGHFLGLRHIWGDGDCDDDDYCNDTPNCDGDFYGCTNPGEQCEDAGDRMIENYLDYSDDACMNIFTIDQNDRIQAVMANSPRRMSLPTAGTCCPEDYASLVPSDYNGYGISCFGAADGSLTVSTSGGTAPFTYAWDANAGNATTATVNNLPAGTYEVTVSDANGCPSVVSATITSPPLLTASASVTSDYNGWDISCYGAMDGEATVAPNGGVPDYSYLWSDGQTTAVATGLDATSYTVTVTDLNGCTTTASVSLTQPDPLTIEAGDNQTVYFGYPPAACADIEWSGAGGGVPPYNIQWSDGGGQAHEVCPEVTTVYTVSITDANGCLATDDVMICAIDVRCGKNLNKVEICHFPPDNPSNNFTLCVGLNAVADHLAHGDVLAACGTDHNCPPAAAFAGQTLPGKPVAELEAFPNPFSDRTGIRFVPGTSGEATLDIFDMLGQPVARLFSDYAEAGTPYRVTLREQGLAAGLYLCVLQTADGQRASIEILRLE